MAKISIENIKNYSDAELRQIKRNIYDENPDIPADLLKRITDVQDLSTEQTRIFDTESIIFQRKHRCANLVNVEIVRRFMSIV